MSLKLLSPLKVIPLILVMLFPASCAKSQTAVSFDGGSISLQEVDEKAKMERYQIEQQLFEIRQQAAYELVRNRVLEFEAKAQKKNIDQLIDEAVQKQPQIDDAQLRQIYEFNKSQMPGSYDQVKGKLREQIEKQARNKAHDELASSLFKKYNVKSLLVEPVAPKIDIDLQDDPFWGPKDAKVTFVEFSDFECPYCKRLQPGIQQIKSEYGDRVRWVFKDFPLDFHAQAMPAHIAANCAHKQGKYFDMQQRIFNQEYDSNRKLDIGPAKLNQWAKDIGLDMAKYDQCFADKDGSIKSEINNDMQYGQTIGVRGTPTLFVNGTLANNARSYDELKELIEKLLKE